MKILKRLLFLFILFIIIGEIALRFYGFCKAPLYYSSKEYEYLTFPNQEGTRFGNRYYFNAFAQRSQEPSKKKKRILGLGDSVLNGGVPTDQDSLATTILSKATTYQFLNVSAGSWGPDNLAAYLKRYGTFNAEKMVLVCSSHDSHDNMDFMPVVGNHPSYPHKQYSLAWIELIDRYLWPRIFGESNQGNDIIKNGIEFNNGFDSLLKIANKDSIDFILYLHPEQSEISAKKYTEQGDEIIEWAKKNQVTLIKGLDLGFVLSDYRDNIHLNEAGQRKLAQVLKIGLKL